MAFDFGSGIRLLEHVGAGFLSGLGGAPEVSGAADYIFSTPDKYVLPLRPHGMRVGDSAARGNFASDLYPWLRRRGFKEVQVLIMAALSYPNGYDQPAPLDMQRCVVGPYTPAPSQGLPGSFATHNCTAFEAALSAKLKAWEDLTDPELSFDIWNELDGFAPTQTRQAFDEFFITYRSAVRTIRRLRPGAQIVGPSATGPVQDAQYLAIGEMNYSFCFTFLKQAKAEGVLPNVFSWHDGLTALGSVWPQPPSWIGAHDNLQTI